MFENGLNPPILRGKKLVPSEIKHQNPEQSRRKYVLYGIPRLFDAQIIP